MAENQGLPGLMKNVFTFANILNQAGTEAAKKWNQQSINNAFNWAAYCEKIHDEVRGKPYEAEVNRKIRGLTIHLTPPSCLVLDLQDMKSASKILFSVLMRNPYVPSHLLQKSVTQQLKEKENFVQLCRTATQEANSVNIVNQVQHMLLMPPDDQTLVAIEAQATVMLKSLLSICQQCEKPQRFESYLNSLLTRVSGMNNGWGCIVALLVVGVDLMVNENIEITAQTIHNIVLKWLQHSSQLYREIREVPLFILCQAAVFHEEFFTTYIKVLKDAAGSIQRSYGVKDSRSLWEWRHKTGVNGLGFEELCLHFSSLLDSNEQIKQCVCSQLKTESYSSHFNIYKDIICALKGKKNRNC